MASVSPFIAALPSQHVLYEYDAEGDTIMTDALTGSPIRYGYGGSLRPRSSSLDSEDSRPSKRSRTSSDEESAPVAPWAPIKAARASADEEDGAFSAVRNLAEQMAEAVLEGEPRPDPEIPFIFARIADNPHGPQHPIPGPLPDEVRAGPSPVAPPGGAAAEADEENDGGSTEFDNNYGDSDNEEPEWIIQATVPDLALRLDMRHPRVLLAFLRFVDTYNELAPEGEEIHIPHFSAQNIEYVRNHEGVNSVPPEFEGEVAELLALLERYRKRDA